jgi:hypothetical protein
MSREVDRITVYRDDPVWEPVLAGRLKWFMISTDHLTRLHVATYDVIGEHVGVEDVRRHAKEVEKMHPGCVLVHL